MVYLEAGCLWVHFILERLHHRFEHSGKNLANVVSRTAPIEKLAPMDYIKQGNIYFSSEVEDVLLPHVLDLVGDGQMMFASDMPHGDRERFAAKTLQDRQRYQRRGQDQDPGSQSSEVLSLTGFLAAREGSD